MSEFITLAYTTKPLTFTHSIDTCPLDEICGMIHLVCINRYKIKFSPMRATVSHMIYDAQLQTIKNFEVHSDPFQHSSK